MPRRDMEQRGNVSYLTSELDAVNVWSVTYSQWLPLSVVQKDL